MDQEFEEQVCDFEEIIDACKEFMMKYGESKASLLRGIEDGLQ